ncbi:MAG TPA: folate-binding protein [Hyphomicrobiales bacterium]|nr:folate-binding protein [Hyphomicrobiales bacterium]
MGQVKGAILADRGVVRVAGEEAVSFLQGLVTADVAGLAPGAARFAALLTPQGKILFDFLLLRAEGGFLLDGRAEALAELVKRLTFYKLRAKVEISDESGAKAVLALWGGTPQAGGFYEDPRAAALGFRAIADKTEAERLLQEAGAETVSLDDYHAHRILLGVPEGGRDFAFGDTFPHEANMDRLSGVSFSKGCFVGQEVVSRMQHRGTARSRILPVAISGSPEAGSEIRAGGKALGSLLAVQGERGLALLRLDRVEAAQKAGDAITAGEADITPLKPVWERAPAS